MTGFCIIIAALFIEHGLSKIADAMRNSQTANSSAAPQKEGE